VIGVVAALVALAVPGARQRPTSVAPESPRSSPMVVLGRAAPRAAPRVRARAGAREAGQRFLRGYVAFLYGRRDANELEGASADLRRARVRVSAARGARTPTIIDLRAVAQAPTVVQVTATVDDGDLAAYLVTAFVERRAGCWLVTHVGDD
jgi:hypothetical protein